MNEEIIKTGDFTNRALKIYNTKLKNIFNKQFICYKL